MSKLDSLRDWIDQDGPGCCPDPEEQFDLPLDDDGPRQDDDAITGHGFDSRCTPVDVLMAGPASMHLQYGHDMEYGDYA